ncbi:MAG: hypothetical protein CMM25_03060, partial [Rhodospirillaceae bacterium]|nr:hypothetical protein [Rhodospirillaceae bacterium]
MLIMCQSSWSPSEPKELATLVGAARREVDRQREDNQGDALLLLPHSPISSRSIMLEEEVFELLSTVSKKHNLFVAGSAVMLVANAVSP